MHVTNLHFQVLLLKLKIVAHLVVIIVSNVVQEELQIMLIVLVLHHWQFVIMAVTQLDTTQIQLFHLHNQQHRGHIQKLHLSN